MTSLNTVMKTAISLETNGALTYSGALQLLDDEATGGMTAAKFSGLEAVASELNATGAGAISTSAYVQQIFDDVVDGNAANVSWNGGSATATALGNMTASSSATQVNELIGKWFLGTDLPSDAGTGLTLTYKAVTDFLFSAGGPEVTDVNQGDDGDCYFLSALANTAQQDPSLIENMIQENSNGTYSVEFQLNGKADFVTVNNELPMLPAGYAYGDGSTYAFDHGGSAGAANDWSALIKKAFVEFCEQTSGVISYEFISGGWDNGLAAITGQSVNDYGTASGESASALGSLLTTMKTALASGEDVLMSTNGADTAINLVAGHMYSVMSVNTAAQTVTLDNPWNGSNTTAGLSMQFTDSISALAANGVTFHVAVGKAAAA